MENQNYRMVQMQIMNLVNRGNSKNIPPTHIRVAGESIINGAQLFLSDAEIQMLHLEFSNRLRLIQTV